MAQRSGRDCCGTCEFNSIEYRLSPISRAEERVFRCTIRDIKVDRPFWTCCYNHQRRNPLLSGRPRGPLWATVLGELRPLPLPPLAEAIPEFRPPRDLEREQRIPYYSHIRPLDSDAGVCQVCQGEYPHTIALRTAEDERLCFCSVGHYLAWWFEHAPQAKALQGRRRVPSQVLFDDLNELLAEIDRLDASPTLDAGTAMDVLAGLEGALIQTGHGFLDLAKSSVLINAPDEELGHEYSKHLLKIGLLLAEVGQLAQNDPIDAKALHLLVGQIAQVLRGFLEGEPFTSDKPRKRWWSRSSG